MTPLDIASWRDYGRNTRGTQLKAENPFPTEFLWPLTGFLHSESTTLAQHAPHTRLAIRSIHSSGSPQLFTCLTPPTRLERVITTLLLECRRAHQVR